MRMYDIILAKRQGKELTNEEIDFFIKGYTEGTIPDYQASALLMAIFLKDMTEREIVEMTRAMMDSGDKIDLSAIEGFKADKHSTGGVGDKTSLVIAPLVASFGVPMAKMSGRGLGHTGGTVDKLESIPGFSTELSKEDFFHQVAQIGLSIISQTTNIAPADKKLYALRDVTATIDHPAMIASSIMSKKLAAGSDGIMLDVKVGDGAFLKTLDEAKQVAKLMVMIGEGMNKPTRAILTNMDQPLGFTVGNSLEVEEARATLKGQGPKDLSELCLELSAGILVMAQKFTDPVTAYQALRDKITSGQALQKFDEWIKAQGGTGYEFKAPLFSQDVILNKEGYISRIQAQAIGEIASLLGAGRLTMEDSIDPSAGIRLYKKVGDPAGGRIATLYTDNEQVLVEAETRLLEAFEVTPQAPRQLPLIYGFVHQADEDIVFERYEKGEKS
ncbi:MAG TPA: thymidine phosphorylase [Tissierellia bacterium]|nr:thymidine phosphorylase [Tissierellia bacterium]